MTGSLGTEPGIDISEPIFFEMAFEMLRFKHASNPANAKVDALGCLISKQRSGVGHSHQQEKVEGFWDRQRHKLC